MRKMAPPPAPLPVKRVTSSVRTRIIVPNFSRPAPSSRVAISMPEPEEPERPPIEIPEPVYLPYEPLLLPMKTTPRLRYFWSHNASRQILVKQRLISFTRTKNIAGTWQGYYVTDNSEYAQAIAAFSAGNRAFREVTASEFELLTGLKQDSQWKIEDFMGTVPIINAPTSPPPKRIGGRIIHCLQRWKHRTPEWDRRVAQARETWVTLYMSGDVIPAHYWEYKRSSLEIGDKRCLPYLKDILEFGLSRSTHDDDILMLTNDDSVLHPRTAEVVFEKLKKVPVTCSGRVNFNHGEFPDFTRPIGGSWGTDIGRDLFAMRKKWLLTNWNKIPDVLVADIEWDLALSAWFRQQVKVKPTLKSRLEYEPKSEIPPGYVFHERHTSEWNKPHHEDTPARMHCRVAMREFYQDQKMAHMITV